MAKSTAKTGMISQQANVQQSTSVQPMEKISSFLSKETTKKWIASAISNEREAQKFVSSIISATTTNVQLQACERNSIVASALLANALQLSLSPQLGLCYMVPFKNKAKYDRDGQLLQEEHYTATFVLGYKGYLQLAIRSGQYKNIVVSVVKQGELISYNKLTDEIELKLIEDDTVREKTPTIGYYAFLKLKNGFEKGIYWSKEKMMVHADKYSAAFNAKSMKDLEEGKIPEKDMWKYSSFWYKSFDDMACKTMLRQLISKWGIMSIDMQSAYEHEISLENGINPLADNGDEEDLSIDGFNSVNVEYGDDGQAKMIVDDDGVVQE